MMAALGNFLFHYRTSLSPLLPLLLLLPGPQVLADPFVAAVLGLLVAAVGQIVRGTTIGLEYIVRGGRNHRVYADNLVTMVLGAGIASNRWPSMLAITAAYAFMYQAITVAEEAYLRQKFGAAFDEYCRDVPRWWPRLRGLPATFARTRFNWSRVLKKGYSEPLGWVLPIVLIALYNLYTTSVLAQRSVAVSVLGGVLSAAALFWLIVGALKKARAPALRGAE
jgi:protein-S-isoprenylcysteine O-methyltransferase Ste14